MGIQGIYRATNPVLGDGDQTQIRVDSSGRLLTGTASPLSTSDLTAARISFGATGDQTIVTATAAQATKVYRIRLTVAGATNISIKDGAATTLEIIQFPAAGMLILDFNTRPYWTTTANTAFILNSSAAVQVEGRVEYLKS
jgi:hypothetical protein